MSTESDAIIMNDIVKTFGHVRALDGLNLSVMTGEVHGFLGPNGAGKSTAIRVLLGWLGRRRPRTARRRHARENDRHRNDSAWPSIHQCPPSTAVIAELQSDT